MFIDPALVEPTPREIYEASVRGMNDGITSGRLWTARFLSVVIGVLGVALGTNFFGSAPLPVITVVLAWMGVAVFAVTLVYSLSFTYRHPDAEAKSDQAARLMWAGFGLVMAAIVMVAVVAVVTAP